MAAQKKLMMMEKSMMMEKQMMMFKQKQMMMNKQKQMQMAKQKMMMTRPHRAPLQVKFINLNLNKFLFCHIYVWLYLSGCFNVYTGQHFSPNTRHGKKNIPF